MKKTLLQLVLLLACIGLKAQEIKPQQAVADDYIRLFNEMGYKVYSFDVSDFKKIGAYQPVIMHFKDGVKDGENALPFGWEVFGKHISNVKVTVSPLEKGKKIGIWFDENSGFSLPLTFHGQKSADGEVSYGCETRPFKQDGKKINDDFHPLVLLGSCWYDPEDDMFRFCGDSEISADLNEDIMKYIPEYYIIGVRFVK